MSFSLSNVSYSNGRVYFRLNFDPTEVYPVRACGMVGVHVNTAVDYLNRSCNILTNKVAEGANYTDFSAVVPLSNNLTDVLGGTHVWQRYGFFLTFEVCDKHIAMCDGHMHYAVSMDPKGIYAFPRYIVPDLGMANSFLGFSFTDGSMIAPPDANTVYVDDDFAQADLLNAAGTSQNPLYDPFDAVQLASLISRAYEHQVAVSIAPGEYEIMHIEHFFAEGADVVVTPSDLTNLPKIYTNEDINNASVYLGGAYNSWHDFMGYNFCPFTVTGSLVMSDLDVSKVNFIGTVKKFHLLDSSYAMGLMRVRFIDEFKLDGTRHSAAIVEAQTPLDWRFRFDISGDNGRWSPKDFIDPEFVSTKWPQFKQWTVPSYSEAVSYYGQTKADMLQQMGFTYSGVIKQASIYNAYVPARKVTDPATGNAVHIDFSVLDAATDVTDFVTKNPHTNNWTSNNSVASMVGAHFRDSSSVRVTCVLGTVTVKNSVFTDAPTFEWGKQFIEVNNTFANSYRHFRTGYSSHISRGVNVSDTWPMAGNTHSGGCYALYPQGYLRDNRYIITDATGRQQKNSIGGAGGSWNFGQLSWLPSTLSVNDIAGRLGQLFTYWAIRYGVYMTPVIASPSNEIVEDNTFTMNAQYGQGTCDYNLGFDLAKFYDAIQLRPLPNSTYIHAGDPASGYNNLDGTRNDVGHLGGPTADANVVARIFWLDSFTTVNYGGLYVGMPLALKGDRSSWAAGATPTFTWSATKDAAPWTPAGGWTNNGTFNGQNQTVTIPAAGVYVFSLTVNEGGGRTDTITSTFNVTSARVFCVDPDKTFQNNEIPAPGQGQQEVNVWTFTNKTQGFSPVQTSKKFDGVATSVFTLDHIAQRTATLTQNTKYYFKLKLGRENTKYAVNSTTRFKLFIVDGAGNLLFNDRGEMKATDFLTVANKDGSIIWGTGTGYFRVGANTSVSFYVVADNGTDEMTYIASLLCAPADEEQDAIYQDLRLAIRHHEVGDEVHVAGSVAGTRVDVPLRVAGKKIHFQVKGGYKSDSHNGTDYTVRDPDTYKTFLNYLRFAWFAKQRDWAYNAISLYLTCYFPSEISGFKVHNLNPDTPNSYAYNALNVNLITHQPITVKDISVQGIYKVGDITVYSDELLTTQSLLVDNIGIDDCTFGLAVNVQYCDVEVRNMVVGEIPTAPLIVAAKEGPNHPRYVHIHDNTFDDSGCGDVLDFNAVWLNDPIYRRMATPDFGSGDLTLGAAYPLDAYTQGMFGKTFMSLSSHIVINMGRFGYEAGTNAGRWLIEDNQHLATTGKKALAAVSYAGAYKTKRVRIRNNTVTGVKRAVLEYICNPLLKPSSVQYPKTLTAVNSNALANHANVDAFITHLEADGLDYIAVYGNTVQGCSSIVEYVTRVPHAYYGHDIIVAENTKTDVTCDIYMGVMTYVGAQGMHRCRNWWHLANNSPASARPIRYFWNMYEDQPTLSGWLVKDMLANGKIPPDVYVRARGGN